MTELEIINRVVKSISSEWNIPEKELRLDKSFAELGVNSLDVVELLMNIEDDMEIEFTDEESLMFTNLNDIIRKTISIILEPYVSIMGEPNAGTCFMQHHVCRICGGTSFNSMIKDDGRVTDKFICDTCSVVFVDPMKMFVAQSIPEATLTTSHEPVE